MFHNPGQGQDIVLPEGYQVEVFARNLNFPMGIAFEGKRENFRVMVVESGTGLPSRCNDNEGKVLGGKFDPNNPLYLLVAGVCDELRRDWP